MSDFERLFPIGILRKSRNRELKPDFEKGEFFLADYLNKNLPKEWNIYTRPELKARWGSNQNKKTPDVVIAHPSDGIMIFEVKNWNISNFFVDEIKKIGFRTRVDIYQKNLKGRSGNLNPVDQAENYLWRVVYQINHQVILDHRYNLIVSIKIGLFMFQLPTTSIQN